MHLRTNTSGRVARRALLGMVLALGAVAAMSPSVQAQGRNKAQGAQAAKAGEDQLDSLLRRFGPEHAGLAEKIRQAIDKGCDYLLKQQQPDGSFDSFRKYYIGFTMGGTALPLLALKKSIIGLYDGTKRELARDIKKLEREKERNRASAGMLRRLAFLKANGEQEIARRKQLKTAVDRGIQWLRGEYKRLKGQPNARLPGGDKYRTYGIGVTLMLLEAYYTRRTKKRGEYVVQVDPRKMPPQDLAWVREMVAWLEQMAKVNSTKAISEHGWRYPGNADGISDSDVSNSQYAVLGLKAASRMGVHMRNVSLWKQVVEYAIAAQDKDGPVVKRKPVAQEPSTGEYFFPPTYQGEPKSDKSRGWSYHFQRRPRKDSTGAMTTAGLAALVTARAELFTLKVLPRDKKLDERISRAINDGIAWLGQNFTVDTNPGEGTWHYYYLYGLERAGILCQQEFFGTRPWYVEGAKFLVGRQQADGHWDSNRMGRQSGATDADEVLSDTSFAILFLKRATTPIDVPLKVPKPMITERGNNK